MARGHARRAPPLRGRRCYLVITPCLSHLCLLFEAAGVCMACAWHVHGACFVTLRGIYVVRAGPPLHMVAGLNLSGLSSGTVHRAVGVSSAGRVHDASWDTESLFLTLQVILLLPLSYDGPSPSRPMPTGVTRLSPPCLTLTLQAILDRPSVAPVHRGSSVGHALRRLITERRASPGIEVV